MSETYSEMQERHERELREWFHRAIAGGKSINAVARETGVNSGTIWRLFKRYGRGDQ